MKKLVLLILVVLIAGLSGYRRAAASPQQASNLSFSAEQERAYQAFRKQATFEGYVFRDLRTHKVLSKSEFGVLDPESNAYLKPTGLNLLSLHIDVLPPGMFNAKHRGPVEGINYILSGHGYTILEPSGEKPQRIEWNEGDMLSIPANAWHQNFNLDKTRPARVLAVGDGGLIARLGIPALPDPENDRYGKEIEEFMKKNMAKPAKDTK